MHIINHTWLRTKFISHLLIILCIAISQVSGQSVKTRIDSINSISHDALVSNIRKSIKTLSENIKEAESIGYKYGQAKALMLLGKAYYLNGKFDLSTEVSLKAFDLFIELNAVADLAFSYGEFGYYIKRRDLSKAFSYMKQGIKIAEKNNLNKELTTLYDNFGVLHEMNKAVDSASFYYKKALELKYAQKDTIGIPYSINNLAGIAAMQNRFQDALKLLADSDRYRNKEKGSYGKIVNLVRYGDIYRMMAKSDSAILKYRQAINFPGAGEHSYLLQYCFQNLSDIYDEQKEYYNALTYYKKYSAIKDSLVNVQTNSKIAELEIDYETEKKDRLLSENRLIIEERENQLIISFALIAILGLGTLLIYRDQKNKKERIREEFLLKSQIEKAENEKRISDQKLRISRELHDNIGSQLTFMISSLDNMTYTNSTSKLIDKINTLSNFGRETIKELRNTIWAMKESDTNINNLIMKITELKQTLLSTGCPINIYINNKANTDIRLNATINLNLYRIVQEALQNAVKYSGATEIEIFFSSEHYPLQMILTDNGHGFDIEKITEGHGLKNMRQRCEDSGGNFNIESTKIGTKISCRFEQI